MDKGLVPSAQRELIPEISTNDPSWPVVDSLAKTIIENPDGTREIARLPSAAERKEIGDFCIRMRAKLRPVKMAMATKEAAMRAIAAMLGRFPSLRNADVPGMCTAYLLDFEDFPLFAIERVCEDVRKGRVAGVSDDFPPASPRLYKLIDGRAADERVKLIAAEKVLTTNTVTRIATPQDRDRAAELMRQLQQNWRMRVAEERADHEARVADKPWHPKKITGDQVFVRRAWEGEGGVPTVGRLDKDGPARIVASPYLERKIRGE